jgi:hypothetical protein
MTHSPSSSSIAPEPSTEGNGEVINSTDIPHSNPSAVAAKAMKQENESSTDDEPLDGEPQNQLGVPEHYLAYFGHCE